MNAQKGVNGLAFSPDGALLAEGSTDWTSESSGETISLWQVPAGKLLRTLRGGIEKVYSVAFSPDGTLLASGADDHSVRLWGIAR